jgi:methionyl-tRNA synthetase
MNEDPRLNPAPPAGAASPPALEAPAVAPTPPPTPTPTLAEDARVGIEDFLKLEIRAARIVAAERVPKSRKLMKLDVDLGGEHRTLVAGIAEAYDPEALVGRIVAIVVNLKPATLMGIQSNGMILAASAPGGLPILVAFDKEPPLGARIK